MSIYVLDSNFFIQAHRDSYPIDLALTFWQKVKDLAYAGTIVSIDKVKNELYTHPSDPEKQDLLEKWCHSNLPADFFKDTTLHIPSYQRVVEWANSKSGHYSPTALNEFLAVDEADAFLIAYALSDHTNCTIVTLEKSDPLNKKRIKIPEPCKHFNVRYINSMTLFRELGETF